MAKITAVYFGDIDDGTSVTIDNCYTVQDMDYLYNHTQSTSGVNVGSATQVAELNFTIRSQESDSAKALYTKLNDGYVVPFSFMYEAKSTVPEDGSPKYVEFNDAMVVYGYVTSVEERFTSSSYRNATMIYEKLSAYDYKDEQRESRVSDFMSSHEVSNVMSISVGVVIHSISYLSRLRTGDVRAFASTPNVELLLK